ncbi:uncharacterized protein MONOS_18340 [Monocercomonoides exilis]|uniref:uncharacterized protein n=1 Tax=Monocercomonoides exilis TaxID=2049356 RepID=UPI003559B883|nr:hypothetical protein MONOS_18340 [Monocercomonoides exilis]
MGKYFKAKKMIGYEQEYRKEREAILSFFKRFRSFEIILIYIVFNDDIRDFCHLFCMLHNRTMLNMSLQEREKQFIWLIC